MGYHTDWNGTLKVQPAIREQDRKIYNAMLYTFDWPWENTGLDENDLYLAIVDNGIDSDGMIQCLKNALNSFFIPYGYTISGTIEWQGDCWDDTGTVILKDNKVDSYDGRYNSDMLRLASTEDLVEELGRRHSL